jgi:hypothetical protein
LYDCNFGSQCIFAGVLVTLALVMISTINTTRARAGFDSQAESIFFCPHNHLLWR